jgi:hypothetical protein
MHLIKKIFSVNMHFLSYYHLLDFLFKQMFGAWDYIIEPCHDKINIMGLRPAWIQTSLRIRKPIMMVLS